MAAAMLSSVRVATRFAEGRRASIERFFGAFGSPPSPRTSSTPMVPS